MAASASSGVRRLRQAKKLAKKQKPVKRNKK